MTRTIKLFVVAILSIFAIGVTGIALATDYGFNETNPAVIEKHTKSALTEWVLENAHTTLTNDKANAIVNIVYKYAQEHSIDPVLILSIIHNESGFRENVTSAHGAKGLMQVMPRWHKDKLKGRSPYSAAVSIEVGTKIIDDCLDKFNNVTAKALNCYSGGGGKKYQTKIALSHKKMRNHLVEYLFQNQLPLYSSNNFQQPRLLHETTKVLLAAAQ